MAERRMALVAMAVIEVPEARQDDAARSASIESFPARNNARPLSCEDPDQGAVKQQGSRQQAEDDPGQIGHLLHGRQQVAARGAKQKAEPYNQIVHGLP